MPVATTATSIVLATYLDQEVGLPEQINVVDQRRVLDGQQHGLGVVQLAIGLERRRASLRCYPRLSMYADGYTKSRHPALFRLTASAG